MATALTSSIESAVAEAHLRSHDLPALFTQVLGWTSEHRAASEQHYRQICVPIASKDQVRVWQVLLSHDESFTTELRQGIYNKLAQEPVSQQSSPPLVIFINSARSRSLWCQSRQQNISPVASTDITLDTALYVSGQPLELWEFRLRRLKRNSTGLFLSSQVEDTAIGDRIDELLSELCEGITGIEQNRDKFVYAWTTLQRLLFLQQIQQQGWLDKNLWYLQTQFEIAQRQQQNFFAAYLQPLYRAIALPVIERPVALQNRLGELPFAGQLFEPCRIERAYESIAIANLPFEELLGWLSEQSSTDRLNPWMDRTIGTALEQQWQSQFPAKSVSSLHPAVLNRVCKQTLDRLLLRRIGYEGDPSELVLEDVLFSADSRLCRRFIQEILPTLNIVDPACGCGMLISELYRRLVDIYGILNGCIQQTQDAQLKLWQSGLTQSNGSEEFKTSTRSSLLANIQRKLLKNTLYGVDDSVEIVETARSYLLIHLAATMQQPPQLEPLPDLSFTIMPGNALVGFITVDEERFDQVNRAGVGSILQGNLLQPLAADSYQTILSEKTLLLEHFKFRNQMLAKASIVPRYARDALLREEMLTLDEKAQNKLDTLLLNYMSQQLGIQYKESRLEGKPQRRSLIATDITALHPYHWGYHFNQIIRKGGFDIVVCRPPQQALKPTVEEFVYQYSELCASKGINRQSMKTSKAALAKADPEIAQAWFSYQSSFSYLSDYFYRSEQYAHQHPTEDGKRGRNQLGCDRLYIERCHSLLAAGGIATTVIAGSLETDQRALTLLAFLKQQAGYQENDISQEGKQRQISAVTWYRQEQR